MKRIKKIERVGAAMEPLRKRLDGWRAGNKGRRLGIPEEIWREAVKAAERHGVSIVRQILRLDYRALKGRLKAPGYGVARAERQREPAFIELRAAVPSGVKSNAIEFQRPGGSKVRIEFQNELSKGLSRLSERLWRSAK